MFFFKKRIAGNQTENSKGILVTILNDWEYPTWSLPLFLYMYVWISLWISIDTEFLHQLIKLLHGCLQKILSAIMFCYRRTLLFSFPVTYLLFSLTFFCLSHGDSLFPSLQTWAASGTSLHLAFHLLGSSLLAGVSYSYVWWPRIMQEKKK